MRPILLFIAFNLTTCGVALPAGNAACHWLPLPAAPVVILFLVSICFGLLFVSSLWLAKQKIDP